jgi:hypothetical protein
MPDISIHSIYQNIGCSKCKGFINVHDSNIDPRMIQQMLNVGRHKCNNKQCPLYEGTVDSSALLGGAQQKSMRTKRLTNENNASNDESDTYFQQQQMIMMQQMMMQQMMMQQQGVNNRHSSSTMNHEHVDKSMPVYMPPERGSKGRFEDIDEDPQYFTSTAIVPVQGNTQNVSRIPLALTGLRKRMSSRLTAPMSISLFKRKSSVNSK